MLKVLEKQNIIKLKNIFVSDLFIIVLIVILNIYLHNIFFALISLFYLFYRCGVKSCLILLFIMLILLLRLNLNGNFIKYAYVYSKTNKLILNNLIYQIETNNIETKNYKVGDIVELNEEFIEPYESIDKLKNNIYFKYSDYPIKTTYNLYTLRYFLNDKIDKIIDSNLRAFLYKFILLVNDYDNLENSFIDISFSIYALYLILYKILKKYLKYKCLSELIIIFIIFELYDINLNSLRILLMMIYYNQSNNKISSLTNIVLILLLYNPCCIYSLSFILPIGLRLLINFDNKLDFKTIILLMQSMLLGRVSVIKLLFYRSYLCVYSIIYIISIICLYLKQDFLKYVYEFVKLIESFDILEIKGQLNVLVLIGFIFLIKEFKICNKYLTKLIMILLVISNISNIYASVSYIDVGQGDSILIRSPFNVENILIDTGSNYNYYKLKKYLDNKGVYQIDYLIISHFDKDHSGNLKSLVKDYNVKQIIYEHKNINTKYISLQSLNDNIWNNKNDNSLVYFMHLNGLNYLFNGDISFKVEDYLIDQNPNLNIDILKLSHHGSNSGNSLRFMYYTNPIIAIASTSGMYNHPHHDIMDNCNKMNIKTFITKVHRDIEIITTKLITFIYAINDEFVIIK